DDVLDFGAPEAADAPAEKSLFADLREGKMTYPLLLAIEREPSLAHRLDACIKSNNGDSEWEKLRARIAASVRASGALDQALDLAKSAIANARESIAQIAPCESRSLLDVVAEATLHRRS